MATEAPGVNSDEETSGQAGEAGTEETPQGDNGEAGGSIEAAAGGTREDQATFLENVTEEELAEIKASPTLSKAYNLMLKDYRGKTTGISEEKKRLQAERDAEAEESRQARTLLDALRSSPNEVIRALAARRGMTVAEVKQEVREAEDDKELVELFGDNWKEVAPTFNTAIEKRVKAITDPIIQRVTESAIKEQRREIANDIREFDAELKKIGEGITPEIEKEMDKIAKQLDPAEGVSNKDFLRYIYGIATGGKTKATVTKEVTKRMQDSIDGLEPKSVAAGGHDTGPVITEGMNLRDSLRAVREWDRTKGRR